jgi:hypothetical protein
MVAGPSLWRAEDGVAMAPQRHAAHLCADQLAYGAARAVGADHIAAVRFFPFPGMNDFRDHPVVILLERLQLAAEADLDSRQRLGMRLEDLLQLVLRDPLAVLRVQRILSRRAVGVVLEAAKLEAVHAGGEHDVRRVVDAERRGVGKPVRDPPAAQVLARAHIGRLRARREPHPVVLLDHQARHAALSELDRQRQAHRSGADDENVGLHCSYCGLMPASRTAFAHSSRSAFMKSAAACGEPGSG